MAQRNGASAISDIRRFFPWPLHRADSCRNDAGAPSRSFVRSFWPDRTAGMEISCQTFLEITSANRPSWTNEDILEIHPSFRFKVYVILKNP